MIMSERGTPSRGRRSARTEPSGPPFSLERELFRTIMQRQMAPRIRRLAPGATLVEQGEPGTQLFLLLKGVLSAEVDGHPLAEMGPGSILGERALLEGGKRTATLRAKTRCRVAVISPNEIRREDLIEIARGHHREA